MIQPVSLYFHVPFCRTRCPYCDFYSTTRLPLREAYADALLRAIRTAPAETGAPAATLYFGGGTPYLLGPGLLNAVLEAAARRFPPAKDCEITLEANPGDLELSALRELRTGGFNRLSLGLQAGDTRGLAFLGRRHTLEESAQGVELARRAGFGNLSLDIMLATPGQDEEGAAALCAYAAAFSPEHISAYLLKIEPGTPFAQEGVEARCPGPDQAAALYLTACRTLKERGYRHYEISNFARPGFESRHNSAYWQLRPYLSFGPSAASAFGGKRFLFPRDLDAFLAAEDPWTLIQAEGPAGGLEEYVMLSLRLEEGLDLDQVTKLGGDPAGMAKRAAPLEKAGYLNRRENRIALTEAGWLVSNGVILALLGE